MARRTLSADGSRQRLLALIDAFAGTRVAVFGEAAMFSAQLGGPNRAPMGMNVPLAGQNARLALNIVRWLS